MAGSWDCWISTPSCKKSSDWQQLSDSLLRRRQWVLMNQQTGLFLQEVQGRQVIWTKQPEQAFPWMNPERISTMVKADPELFGDSNALQLVQQTYFAHPCLPHLWSCNA